MVKQSSEQNPKANNDRWKLAGVLVALILSLVGWAWGLGVQYQQTRTNARDIATVRAEMGEVRRVNVDLATEVARLREAVTQLNARLDRER